MAEIIIINLNFGLLNNISSVIIVGTDIGEITKNSFRQKKIYTSEATEKLLKKGQMKSTSHYLLY